MAREVERIKIDLTILEKNWSKNLSDWESKEIFSSLMVLESSTKTGKRIVISSLKRKFFLLGSIFEEYGLTNFERNKRKLKITLQDHIKQRIDNDEKPSPDRAAPLLSPCEWLQIQEWLIQGIDQVSTENFRNKRYMAMASIGLGFSTGLRLTEIHRLKFSDIGYGHHAALKLRIRRSKSNRFGRKLIWQVAPVHTAEGLLCPVQNLMRYIEKMGKQVEDNAYIFSDDAEGKKQTRIENLKNYWVLGAKMSGLPKEKWPKAHSFHAAKVNMARALGYSEEEIVDSMNWQSCSVLQEYLRNTNLSDDGVAQELSRMTAKELTMKTSTIW